MSRCFADNGKICTALKVKSCKDCNFFKTVEQKARDVEKARKRLANLKNINDEEER